MFGLASHMYSKRVCRVCLSSSRLFPYAVCQPCYARRSHCVQPCFFFLMFVREFMHSWHFTEDIIPAAGLPKRWKGCFCLPLNMCWSETGCLGSVSKSTDFFLILLCYLTHPAVCVCVWWEVVKLRLSKALKFHSWCFYWLWNSTERLLPLRCVCVCVCDLFLFPLKPLPLLLYVGTAQACRFSLGKSGSSQNKTYPNREIKIHRNAALNGVFTYGLLVLLSLQSVLQSV